MSRQVKITRTRLHGSATDPARVRPLGQAASAMNRKPPNAA
jgi:hypothetical protein